MTGQGRAQITGRIVVALACLQMLLFVYGVLRKSYLALALPVTVAMTALTALGFWVGWTMMTMEEEPEEPPVTVAE
ncbi:MAG TPA: hypothetical protein VNN10_11625 [Dehalococcoidia bacterium]|nr:hypothetical protein [Dehalococcoidia bacterium]